MSKRKKKSAEQIAAEVLAKRVKDFASVQLSESQASMSANSNVAVVRAGNKSGTQKASHDTVRRLDVFDALRDGMQPGSYDSARKLETAIYTSMGQHDRGRALQRVDSDQPETDSLDQMLTARSEVKRILGLIGMRDAWLLSELIWTTLECGKLGGSITVISETGKSTTFAGWRAIVYHITAETNEHSQGAAVRSACANLASAYEVRERAA